MALLTLASIVVRPRLHVADRGAFDRGPDGCRLQPQSSIVSSGLHQSGASGGTVHQLWRFELGGHHRRADRQLGDVGSLARRAAGVGPARHIVVGTTDPVQQRIDNQLGRGENSAVAAGRRTAV